MMGLGPSRCAKVVDTGPRRLATGRPHPLGGTNAGRILAWGAREFLKAAGPQGSQVAWCAGSGVTGNQMSSPIQS